MVRSTASWKEGFPLARVRSLNSSCKEPASATVMDLPVCAPLERETVLEGTPEGVLKAGSSFVPSLT